MPASQRSKAFRLVEMTPFCAQHVNALAILGYIAIEVLQLRLQALHPIFNQEKADTNRNGYQDKCEGRLSHTATFVRTAGRPSRAAEGGTGGLARADSPAPAHAVQRELEGAKAAIATVYAQRGVLKDKVKVMNH